MVTGTLVAVISQERHQLGHTTLVNAESLRETVQVVEHLEEQSRWLVNRANHSSTLLRQSFHQRHTLATRSTVQTPAE